jgi:hypothetical protein
MRIFLVLVAMLAYAPAAYVHHSLAATFDQRTVVTLEGKITQFLYRNPHSFVRIEAPDEHGAMQQWAIEWGGASQLERQGIKRDTFRIGDILTITANPGRNPADHKGLMISVRRKSDGFGWGQKPGEVVD